MAENIPVPIVTAEGKNARSKQTNWPRGAFLSFALTTPGLRLALNPSVPLTMALAFDPPRFHQLRRDIRHTSQLPTAKEQITPNAAGSAALLCLMISSVRNQDKASSHQVTFLFHVALTKVIQWCPAGGWPHLRGPRQPHSLV